MKVLILAGGYGTRLGDLVKDIPKALLDVKGKLLIDYVMDKVKNFPNLEEVVVVTNDKFYTKLLDWAQGYENFTCPVHIANDGTTSNEDRLGSIGDMQFVFDQQGQAHDWMVIGSDNIFDYGLDDYIAFAQERAPHVTLGSYDIENKEDATIYGVVELDSNQKVVSFEEKPQNPKTSLIMMCLYYIPAQSLGKVKEFLESTHSSDAAGGFIEWLYQQSNVFGFKFSGKWYDIGSIESYQEAQKYFT